MRRPSSRAWVGAIASLAVGGGLIAWAVADDEPLPPPIEVATRPIPFEGGAEAPEAEISGLAWYGSDTLVLLPQYPERFAHPESPLTLLTLRREEIEAFLDGRREPPLTVSRVPLEAPELEQRLPGFDGFEAIAFAGDRVYVTIETHRDEEGTVGWLVAGEVEGALSRVVLDASRVQRLRSQNDLPNIGYEALVIRGEEILALYETNGAVNAAPTALVFDLDLTPVREEPMAAMEYRLTDATEADRDGRFWVSNYHWPLASWATGECLLTTQYGQGESHARCHTVERLVELRVTEHGVEMSDTPPIQLELVDDEHPRNWEGVVRMPGRGFLLVTDEHPASMLAFVPAPGL